MFPLVRSENTSCTISYFWKFELLYYKYMLNVISCFLQRRRIADDRTNFQWCIHWSDTSSVRSSVKLLYVRREKQHTCTGNRRTIWTFETNAGLFPYFPGSFHVFLPDLKFNFSSSGISQTHRSSEQGVPHWNWRRFVYRPFQTVFNGRLPRMV